MPEKKIIDKIDDIHMEIYRDPFGAGGRLAQRLQAEAWQAALEGLPGNDNTKMKWKNYMCNFASNKAQLDRLCGKDTKWIAENDWALPALAYIVASSTCGIITTTGTRSNLSREMAEGLDEKLDLVVGETDCPKVPIDSDEPVPYI